NLAGMKTLCLLDLSATPITDAGLANIKALPQVRQLWLNSTPITDAGLAHVAGLTRIEELHLASTGVTGGGLGVLRASPVQTLDLSGVQVGDEAVVSLAAMPALRSVNLRGTRLTSAGLRRLCDLVNQSGRRLRIDADVPVAPPLNVP
ncbi:MAG: hypothetical protein ABSH20_03360, partial [Tepidisphaeraceae bacterium]